MSHALPASQTITLFGSSSIALACALLGLPASLETSRADEGIQISNGSFEQGNEAPVGWSLDGGTGMVVAPGAVGQRAIAVKGDGKSNNGWLSDPIPFQSRTVYRLTFQARRIDGVGGLAVTGPLFCNRDLSSLTNQWSDFESYFATPDKIPLSLARLRFGQWELQGQVEFDDIHLDQVIPVYRTQAGIPLGEGETIQGREYRFAAPYRQASANHARPLVGYQGRFNTHRWQLSSDASIVYRHDVGRSQTAAEVHIQVGWYRHGELVVEASPDGDHWQTLGTVGELGSKSFPVPTDLLPSEAIWIRITTHKQSGHPELPSLQIYDYGYTAQLSGEPLDLIGQTRFLAVTQRDPQLDVTIEDIGEAMPGGENVIVARVRNRSNRALQINGQAVVSRVRPESPSSADPIADSWSSESSSTSSLLLGTGGNNEALLHVPYALTGSQLHRLRFKLEGDVNFSAETEIDVPLLHSAHFGQQLPGSTDTIGLWWCSSGWKVGATRPLPGSRGRAIVVQAAANESEAAQLVIRPRRPIKGLTAEVGELVGGAGSKLTGTQIELLRVGYVDVTQPTDETSTVGAWPDPLPPLSGPVDVAADQNFPLWVRVNIPQEQPAGTYHGTIRLHGQDYNSTVPLEVEVFGFELPDRMTCTSAFGFDASLAWRYHQVKSDADRRLVLASYFQCLSDHHISPYRPAPLDPIRVTWKDLTPRSGGDRDIDMPRSDNASKIDLPPGKEQAVEEGLEASKLRGPEPTLDFSAWDRAMSRAIDKYHFNTFRLGVPGLGGGTFHQRHEPELQGFAEHTPQYQAAMKSYLGQLQSHLKDRGWIDEAFVYWFDEPDPKDYEFVNNGFAKLKRWAPDIPRMLTEQVEPELIGSPTIWCPISSSFQDDQAEERRQAGEKFWWYVCTGPKAPFCTLFIDHPATELRVWLWQTWQRNIEGILVWQSNYWTSSAAYPDPRHPQNPYDDPMGWVTGYSTQVGTKRAWGNGDGRFLYPPEKAADGNPKSPVLDPPVASIRLEMLRDGLEDYEYMVILKALLKTQGDRLETARRKQYEDLLKVPKSITESMTQFTSDPAPIEQHRLKLARAIESFER
jgi:hypothetical protein